MKKLILILLIGALTSNIAISQNEGTATFAIQIGAFGTLNPSSFEDLAAINYIYAEKATKTLHRVIMGAYTTEEDAATDLAKVKAIGHKNAFIVTKGNNPTKMGYLIQLASYNFEDLDWTDYEGLSNLYAQVTTDKVKVMIGVVNNLQTANDLLVGIRSNGYKDAFIKHINKDLVHRVGHFEKTVNVSKVESMDQQLAIDPTNVPQEYNITTPTNRASVKELQIALQSANAYKGSANGQLNDDTQNAVDAFASTNKHYADLVRKSNNQVTNTAKGGLQGYIDMVDENPILAYGGLKQETSPAAKTYLAYMYLTDKYTPKGKDKQLEVDRLMNEAIQETFKSRQYQGVTTLDYNKIYHYDNINLLIEHITYIQGALADKPAIPCWMLKKHPEATTKAFENNNLLQVSDCGDFSSWKSIRVLQAAAQQLDPTPEIQKTKSDKARLKAYEARRSQLYLMPTPLGEDEAEITEEWHKLLWDGLDAWSSQTVLQHNITKPLRVAYFDAFVKLENHYIGRGFEERDARLFAISVLRTVVNYNLHSYLELGN